MAYDMPGSVTKIGAGGHSPRVTRILACRKPESFDAGGGSATLAAFSIRRRQLSGFFKNPLQRDGQVILVHP